LALFIQDPNDPNCPCVLERLLDACKRATTGAGAFAFATADGVDLFLGNPVFAKYAKSHSFDLVIGLDGITNPAALKAIAQIEGQCPGLKTHAFIPDRPGTTFHPKFCWFRTSKGGIVITGSGNLTGGGLRRNVEGYDCHEISSADIDVIQNRWEAFKLANATRLKVLSDPDVIKRAEANALVQQALGPVVAEAARKVGVRIPRVELVELPYSLEQAVLIAEIPKASTRWNQANFDIDTFKNYFGAKPGGARTISLRHVEPDGRLGHEEVRPGVAVRSQNYRFELEAASGLAYPAQGRPIAVFVKMTSETFRYRLLMPDSEGHETIRNYLQKSSYAREGRMRRKVITVKELRGVWPDSPLWLAGP
jgi:hypothetical protein